MNNTKRKVIFRHIIYSFLMILFYILQLTPRLLEFSGGKPFWLIPLAVSIAMYEGEFVGGLYGAAAGLLCDTGSSSLFGFHGFFLCAFCVGVGLLVSHLMQPNLVNGLLYTAVTVFFIRNVHFLFEYGIFAYAGISKIYTRQVLLTSLYTVILMIPIYFLIRMIHRKLSDEEKENERHGRIQ